MFSYWKSSWFQVWGWWQWSSSRRHDLPCSCCFNAFVRGAGALIPASHPVTWIGSCHWRDNFSLVLGGPTFNTLFILQIFIEFLLRARDWGFSGKQNKHDCCLHEIYNLVTGTDHKIILQIINAELRIVMNARKKRYNVLWEIVIRKCFKLRDDRKLP